MAVNWAPFSKTALKSIHNSDKFINIYEGAVRSSKTVSSTIAWINFLRESPHREFLMTGNTIDTLYRNVIGSDRGIIPILGSNRASYKKSQEGGAQLKLKLEGEEKICYCVGCSNIKAESKIRGMTIGGWYSDETTTYPEEVVKQAINRMSLDGARAFWTMNPDSPFHYIKEDFIDKANEKGFAHFHFTLDDNLALGEEYKQNIKNAYSGLWYKRMIDGLWVLAEGLIYNMFNPDEHIVTDLPKILKYWVGVDYGTSNATAFILIGLGKDGNLYVVDEYKHSGGDMDRSKTDAEYSQELQKWLGDIKPEWIFVDPSAKSFRTQLYRDRMNCPALKKVYPANNDVIDGIRSVSSLLGAGKLFVHKRCGELIKEIGLYAWDSKAQARGEDKPIKDNDDMCDAFRYSVYSSGIYSKLLKDVA